MSSHCNRNQRPLIYTKYLFTHHGISDVTDLLYRDYTTTYYHVIKGGGGKFAVYHYISKSPKGYPLTVCHLDIK